MSRSSGHPHVVRVAAGEREPTVHRGGKPDNMPRRRGWVSLRTSVESEFRSHGALVVHERREPLPRIRVWTNL